MPKDLAQCLIENLDREMTPAQKEAQRRSFAYGTTKIANEAITRDLVDEAAAKLAIRRPIFDEIHTAKRKRFFHMRDADAAHYLVSRDLEHAKQILRDHGAEFTTQDGAAYPIDALEVAHVTWREIPVAEAAQKRVWLGDTVTSPQSTLAACEVGDWFSTVI